MTITTDVNPWETAKAPSSRTPMIATGIHAFAEDYDLWIVDQWGVLHDGQVPYSGAIDCLLRLLSLGKRVVILSNSGKGSAVNAHRIQAMGLTAQCYTTLITSGEVAQASLAARADPFLPSIGHRCLLITSDEDYSLVDGLDIELVTEISSAEFILLTGVNDDLPMGYYQPILEVGCARGLPLICVNPDLVHPSPRGLLMSAGELGRRYEQMGGIVHYIGKPYSAVYEYCSRVIPNFDPGRTIAIGDSFYHDVIGGARFGLATTLVTGGIHQADFAKAQDSTELLQILANLAQGSEIRPTWIIESFKW